jgi:Ca-activated chloride channel homolog
VDYFFRFAHPWLAIVLLIVVSIAAVIKVVWYKPLKFRYSLVNAIGKSNHSVSTAFKWVPFVLRLGLLVVLGLLIARPQWVNSNSKVSLEGIDIMVVLDASGSMQCFDDIHDQRSRFEVAKTEAIHFIKKRENDPIGLVLFGKDAISRCPLTLDKNILTEIVQDLKLGDINPDGTVLSIGLSMAIKRLKDSKAKSKIIILLTDGEPTPGLDIEPQMAVDLAKKLGIKIYTIGIGGEHGGLWRDPLFGVRQMGFRLNTNLLQAIAQQTGGQFFLAAKPDDMKRIYDTIDTLETTEYETPMFTSILELIIPFGLSACALLLLELVMTSFVWFCV